EAKLVGKELYALRQIPLGLFAVGLLNRLADELLHVAVTHVFVGRVEHVDVTVLNHAAHGVLGVREQAQGMVAGPEIGVAIVHGHTGLRLLHAGLMLFYPIAFGINELLGFLKADMRRYCYTYTFDRAHTDAKALGLVAS